MLVTNTQLMIVLRLLCTVAIEVYRPARRTARCSPHAHAQIAAFFNGQREKRPASFFRIERRSAIYPAFQVDGFQCFGDLRHQP